MLVNDFQNFLKVGITRQTLGRMRKKQTVLLIEN
jgi:hypothetical protein